MSREHLLAQLLNQEEACLKQLLVALNNEHQALLAAEITDIERATSEKNLALKAQTETTRQRQQLTSQHAFEPTHSGLEAFIATCDNQRELTAIFANLASLANQCSSINRSNGRLITQKQQQINGALNILRRTDYSSPTYSGQGNTSHNPTSRSLGKA